LQNDEHLIAFIATELAGLIQQQPDRQAFEQQLEFVEAVITAENKATLARTLHMSRPALYARIKRAETQLNYSLELDAEQLTATHLALMAYPPHPEHLSRLVQRSAYSPHKCAARRALNQFPTGKAMYAWL